MRYFFLLNVLAIFCYAEINTINSFEADFKQDITDDKGKILSYQGHLRALKPQNALWNYKKPVQKDIYVTPAKIIIIEPEIEQVIIRHISSNFDFFKMIEFLFGKILQRALCV